MHLHSPLPHAVGTTTTDNRRCQYPRLEKKIHSNKSRCFGTILVIVISSSALWYYWTAWNQQQQPQQEAKPFQHGNSKFRGDQYWKEGTTLGYETLYETPFARFQIHKITLDKGKTIIDDWLWYDESDNVNVLVEMQGEDNTSLFIVMKQTKYAIDGSTYAVVGGLIEPNELPIDAAKREVQEELNMVSDHWIDLGSYRAAANRGGGTTYAFWARYSKRSSPEGIAKDGAPVVGELEQQHHVKLTKSQLMEAVLTGEFKEIKWTATVALALLQGEKSLRS